MSQASRCILLFAMIATARLLSAEALPVVKVKAIIRSDAIKGLVNLPEAERLAAERIVARIRQRADLSFVKWVEDFRPGDPAARFTVTLYEEKRPGLPSIHHIDYQRDIYAREVRVPHLLLDYAAGESYFSSAAERAKLGKKDTVAEAIASIVMKHIEQKYSLFLKQFLYKIPLSRTAPKIAGDGTVMVALPWDEMGATEKSQLAIQIEAKPPESRTPQKGSIEVWDIFPCAECALTARASLKGFSCPGLAATREQLVKVVDNGLTSSVTYMADYVPSYDGTATDLPVDDITP